MFIERLSRLLKHAAVYVKAYGDGCKAEAGIGQWFGFGNNQGAHGALNSGSSMAVWRQSVTGALNDAVVDMTLLLDNPRASSRCP